MNEIHTATSPRGRKKAAIRVARTIVSEIQMRGLVPGDKLISEEKAVARYGVARGTLREAVRFLEFQGVLQVKPGPGGGPVVARPGSQHLASALSLLLQFAGAPFRDIVDARCAMEPGMAAMAARNASPGDVEALEECVRLLSEGLDDDDVFYGQNRLFHDLVAAASGNLLLAYLIPALHWMSDDTGIHYPLARRRLLVRNKRKILRAIETGDAQMAQEEMTALLDDARRYFEQKQPGVMKAAVSWSEPDAS